MGVPVYIIPLRVCAKGQRLLLNWVPLSIRHNQRRSSVTGTTDKVVVGLPIEVIYLL